LVFTIITIAHERSIISPN